MPVAEPETRQPETRKLIPQSDSRARRKRRTLLDNLATKVVGVGGFSIIASILAILLFIFTEIFPLFSNAEVSLSTSFKAQDILAGQGDAADVALLGLNEHQEIGYILSRTGRLSFFAVKDGAEVAHELFSLGEARVTSAIQSLKGKRLTLGTSDGRAILVEIDFGVRFKQGKRSYAPRAKQVADITLDENRSALTSLAAAGDVSETLALSAITDDARVLLYLQQTEESLFGDAETTSSQIELEKIWSGTPASIALDATVRNFYMGSDDGKIYHWTLTPDAAPDFVSAVRVRNSPGAINTLNFLIGGRTLVAGESTGAVSAWFLVRDKTSPAGWRLTRIHEMTPHPSGVTAVAASARGKGFISGDANGGLHLEHTTSERHLASFSRKTGSAIELISYAPKANGALILDSAGEIAHWLVDNPHPEAGLKAFFGKVWYEGYEEPEHVWQSTGGTDEFEPKLSLVPLIFGSLKGTFYTLILSIPIAVLAALYTSQFMHPALRSKIKPTVEIMAALPSVVLGFLGGLWLAPRIEAVVPAVLLMSILIPVIVILAARAWDGVPLRIRNRFRPGIESMLLVPILLLAAWFCLYLNGAIENAFFGGSFKDWVYQTLNVGYDQRNALVVGMAMGFAVIPIIYTISEDALSNVPRTLISGSLALGATPWQTAIRVVLPTAAAGIFTAVMIGLGRAVGETMIVLMATGNTPIMDWNIFNGFRTLSANIAVEIPEAPVGGTLYRVLFLAAMLLFMITFAVNTVAEVVRQRLREKYQRL